MISFYKQIRANRAGWETVSAWFPDGIRFQRDAIHFEDSQQVVVFAFLHSQQFGRSMPLLHLQGLAEDAMYSVSTIDDKLEDQTEKLSGAYLMHHGIQLRLRGDYDATAIKFDRVQ